MKTVKYESSKALNQVPIESSVNHPRFICENKFFRLYILFVMNTVISDKKVMFLLLFLY